MNKIYLALNSWCNYPHGVEAIIIAKDEEQAKLLLHTELVAKGLIKAKDKIEYCFDVFDPNETIAHIFNDGRC